MANDYTSLADLLVINDAALAPRAISDLLQACPVLGMLAADTVDGTTHKYTKETQAPVIGFRSVNDGRENDCSEDTLVTITLKILDASFACDQALANAYRHGKDAYIGREAARHFKAALFGAEKQFLNGTIGGAAAGFIGMADALDNSDDAMVINAGGTTAATASSVYAIRSTPDFDAVAAIVGNDGVIDIRETATVRLAGTTGFYPGFYTPIDGWMGLQVGGAKSLGRICNLTADSGKGLTDDLIAEMLSEFPTGGLPTFLAMSRRSRMQLQNSRTATNGTGAPAPFPTEAFGIDIVTTDAIVNTEALLTAA